METYHYCPSNPETTQSYLSRNLTTVAPADGMLPFHLTGEWTVSNTACVQRRPRVGRLMKQVHLVLVGTERASLFSYISLVAMSGGMFITFSSIFGWPMLPIWKYLRA